MAILVLLAASPALAWAVYPAQPSGLMVPPLTDLGVVRQGQSSSFDLTLRNPLNRTFVVDRLDSSCLCLTPRFMPVAIPPESEGRVSMELDLGKEPEFTGRLLIRIEGRDSSDHRMFQAQVAVKVE